MTDRSAGDRFHLPEGIDLGASLARFRRHGDDLMDRWDGRRFRRPYRIRGEVGAVWLRRDGAGDRSLAVEAAGRSTPVLPERLRAMFVDQKQALLELGRRDPVIAELHRLYPGVVPVLALDPLGALLAMVTAQQVNLQFALSVRRAILERLGLRVTLGDDFVLAPDPEQMAAAPAEVWSSLRLTRSKGRCLSALGAAVVSGRLSFEVLESAPDGEVRGRLTELPGIGPWTADQYLARVLGRPVVVAGDLGVRKAVQLAYRLAAAPGAAEVLELTQAYGPAAFTAQQLLLYHLSQQPRRAVRPHPSPGLGTGGRGAGGSLSG